jgi:hypothetical protein
MALSFLSIFFIGCWLAGDTIGFRAEEFCPRFTQMHADETRTNELSERIIGCAFRVLNTLGT